MAYRRTRGLIGAFSAGFLCLASACSSIEATFGYNPEPPVPLIDEAAEGISIGQFSDRRGTRTHLLGAVPWTYYSVVSGINADQPVVHILRDVFIQAADDRGMLSESGQQAKYQIYGQMTGLDGDDGVPASASIDLVIRLLDVENNRDVYITEHKVETTAPPESGYAFDLVDIIERAINQVVAKSLDDPDLRAVLLGEGEES
jgi:hypothetical protein